MKISPHTLCFAPKFNTKGRKDATGAFIPEARRFIQHHGLDEEQLVLIDNSASKQKMRRQVLDALVDPAHSNLHPNLGIMFFCHGYRMGMQFGFTTRNVGRLAVAISQYANAGGVKVCFYSCDVGRDRDRQRTDDIADNMGGDGGFADTIRDKLAEHDIERYISWVDGHATAGHTTRNPFVRRFVVESRHGGRGGYMIVPRQKRGLFMKWRSALKTTFRFEFPFLDPEDIYGHLESL